MRIANKGRMLALGICLGTLAGGLLVTPTVKGYASQREIGKDEISLAEYGVLSGDDIATELNQIFNKITEEANGETVTLRIPSGTYYVSGELKPLPSNIYIKAEKTTRIVKKSGTGPILSTTAKNTNKNITIEGGIWDGKKIAGQAVFKFQSADNVNVLNCTVENGKENGIRFADSEGTLKNVVVRNNQTNGVYICDGAKTSVNDCLVYGNKQNGITVTRDSKSPSISRTTSHSNTNSGIVFANNSEGKMQGCNVYSNRQHGITVSNSKLSMTGSKTEQNKITKNYWSGVSVTGSTSRLWVDYGIFSENGKSPKVSSEGESGHGIGIYGIRAEISNATIQNNKVCGISPFGSGTNVTIKKCNITGNGRHGIGARKKVTLTVQDSNIQKNAYHGIMVNDSSKATKISNTTISNNKKNGISVGEKSQATVVDSSINGNKSAGVYLHARSTGTILSSAISDNKSGGINVSSGGILSSCNSNVIQKNGAFGIQLSKAAMNNCKSNKITGHKKYGIGVLNGSKAKGITGNECSNTAAANEIYVNKSSSDVGTTKSLKGVSYWSKKKRVHGTTQKKTWVTVKIENKKYSIKTDKKGAYKISVGKLKQKTKIEISFGDKKGNRFRSGIQV